MRNGETPEPAATDDDPGGSARPPWRQLRRGIVGTLGAACAVATALSMIVLSGDQPSVSDAAATTGLGAAVGKTAAPAAPAAAAPMAAAPVAAPATATNVKIQNYAFSPASLTVPAGSTVTWTNLDTAPHTVTVSSGPEKFNSPSLQKGDTYSFTFTKAGTYSYYCAVHPDMKAKVVVTGSATKPTPTPTATSPKPTATMPMPTPTPSSGGSQTCAVSTALQTFFTHFNAAHLSESLMQQAQDILDIDNYIKLHMVLIQNMLAPLTDGGLTSILGGSLQTFLTHLNAAHLSESPMQQAQDILNINQYLLTHMVLIANMLAPVEAQAC